MIGMDSAFDQLRTRPENSLVLQHLSGQYAHSDLAQFFFERLGKLTKAAAYSPNGYAFPYILAYANDLVFGFCVGMQAMTLKLPDHLAAMAQEDGANRNDRLSEDSWLDFPIFDPKVKPDVDRWLRQAYLEAMR